MSTITQHDIAGDLRQYLADRRSRRRIWLAEVVVVAVAVVAGTVWLVKVGPIVRGSGDGPGWGSVAALTESLPLA